MQLILVMLLVFSHTSYHPNHQVAGWYTSNVNGGFFNGYMTKKNNACFGYELYGSQGQGFFYGVNSDKCK